MNLENLENYNEEIKHLKYFHQQKKKKSLDNTIKDESCMQKFNNCKVRDNESEKKVIILSKEANEVSKLKEIMMENTNDYKSALLDFNTDADSCEELGSQIIHDISKHIPTGELEIGSDESDYDPDIPKKNYNGDRIKVTQKMVKIWQDELKHKKSLKTIKCVVEAFHAAVVSINGENKVYTRYIIEGGEIFNSITQICIMLIPAAFKEFLNIENECEVHVSKRFPKIKGVLKNYLLDLIIVLESVSSPEIIETLLKHLHQMISFTHSFSSLRKPLLHILLKYWSSAEEETIRIIAFLCIVKIAIKKNAFILNGLLKSMYIKYIENSKFVSPNTLPAINFMRHSLSELYLLENVCGYNSAFLYLRQLAIHLRNALILKKKEHFQAVYNWQFINALWFWAEVIPKARKSSQMWSLLYPLVQIIIGVANLMPTSQYYPLRFHCVKMLISISRETGLFIPCLPIILGVLENYNFNKIHKTVSMKPMSLKSLLRVSKSQSSENGYKDALIEKIYELLLECAAKDSHYIYFPDMYALLVVKIKIFLNKCKVIKYTQKIKQLLYKIEEGRNFIETERNKKLFDLENVKDTKNWEKKIKEMGTPTSRFYDSWARVHKFQQLTLTEQNNKDDFDVPRIVKLKRKINDTKENCESEKLVEDIRNKELKNHHKYKKSKYNNDSNGNYKLDGYGDKIKSPKIATKKKTKKNIKASTKNADLILDTKVNDW